MELSSNSSRRETVFPTSADQGKPLQDISRDRAQPTQQAKLKRQIDRTPLPPRLPLSVNPHATQWNPRSAKRLFTSFCINGSPWDQYFPILPDQQAGPVTVVHENCPEFPVYVIKERRLETADKPSRLLKISHPQIVRLHAAYTEKSILFLVYEAMDVSLEQIQRCPYGPFKEFEMATICREIILGLEYIHSELHVSYGRLSLDNILLTRHGNVRIGEFC
jgi:hypothetical protein